MSDFNSDELTTEVVVEQLKSIAETGNVEIAWADLQRAIKLRFENVIDNYRERCDMSKEGQYEEPNVEKFNLDNSRDEILELIASFNEPPFTIQRICELLYSPFKYYDRISTFLRGLEKNLRVISSNDWPKPSIEPKMTDELISDNGNKMSSNIAEGNSGSSSNIDDSNSSGASSSSSSSSSNSSGSSSGNNNDNNNINENCSGDDGGGCASSSSSGEASSSCTRTDGSSSNDTNEEVNSNNEDTNIGDDTNTNPEHTDTSISSQPPEQDGKAQEQSGEPQEVT